MRMRKAFGDGVERTFRAQEQLLLVYRMWEEDEDGEGRNVLNPDALAEIKSIEDSVRELVTDWCLLDADTVTSTTDPDCIEASDNVNTCVSYTGTCAVPISAMNYFYPSLHSDGTISFDGQGQDQVALETALHVIQDLQLESELFDIGFHGESLSATYVVSVFQFGYPVKGFSSLGTQASYLQQRDLLKQFITSLDQPLDELREQSEVHMCVVCLCIYIYTLLLTI